MSSRVAHKNLQSPLLPPPKTRSGASVNAYLVLKKENNLLLYLRKNTGYCDGEYGLVSGHVEDGESATDAIIRESHEEAGIRIKAEDLKVVHIMHRRTNRFNLDIFFECHRWDGTITNLETDKCVHLRYFPTEALPKNLIKYVSDALLSISRKEFYSEQGWDTD